MCLCKCGGNIIVLQCFLPFSDHFLCTWDGHPSSFLSWWKKREVQGYDSKVFCWWSLYSQWCNRSLSGSVSENAEFFPEIVYLDVSWLQTWSQIYLTRGEIVARACCEMRQPYGFNLGGSCCENSISHLWMSCWYLCSAPEGWWDD